ATRLFSSRIWRSSHGNSFLAQTHSRSLPSALRGTPSSARLFVVPTGPRRARLRAPRRQDRTARRRPAAVGGGLTGFCPVGSGERPGGCRPQGPALRRGKGDRRLVQRVSAGLCPAAPPAIGPPDYDGPVASPPGKDPVRGGHPRNRRL